MDKRVDGATTVNTAGYGASSSKPIDDIENTEHDEGRTGQPVDRWWRDDDPGAYGRRTTVSPTPCEHDFVSESVEVQTALTRIGAAPAPLGAAVTWLPDSGFDDVAVWDTIWDQHQHLDCRVHHRDRSVERPDATGCHLADLAPRQTRLTSVDAELVVKKTGQRREKRQPVTVKVAATPLVVRYQHARRTRADGDEQTQSVWLVEVRVPHVPSAVVAPHRPAGDHGRGRRADRSQVLHALGA